MTKRQDVSQTAEQRARLGAYEKAIPQLARATLITQAASRYLHAAKNDMSGISAMLSDLFQRKSVREDKESMQLVAHITAEFEDLREMTNSFTSWFRTPRHMDARPLCECIRQVSDVFGSTLRQQTVALDLRINDESGDTLVPTEVLRESLASLFRNSLDALEAVPTSRHIRITTAKKDECVEIKVEDDGPGISPEMLPTVGKPFFTTRADRHGLGLCLVKWMLEQVGGTFSIGNHPPHGATAVLSVPLNWRKYLNEDNPMA